MLAVCTARFAFDERKSQDYLNVLVFVSFILGLLRFGTGPAQIQAESEIESAAECTSDHPWAGWLLNFKRG